MPRLSLALLGSACLLLTAVLPELRQGPELASSTYAVTAPHLLVRTGPGQTYPIVRSISDGLQVQGFLTRDGQWIRMSPGQFVSLKYLRQIPKKQSQAHRIRPNAVKSYDYPKTKLKKKPRRATLSSSESVRREITVFICMLMFVMAVAWWSFTRSSRSRKTIEDQSNAVRGAPGRFATGNSSQFKTDFWEEAMPAATRTPAVQGREISPVLNTEPIGMDAELWANGGDDCAPDQTHNVRRWEKILTLRLVYMIQKSPADVSKAVEGMIRKFALDPVFRTDLIHMVDLLKPYHIDLVQGVGQTFAEMINQWRISDDSEAYYPRELIQAFLTGLDAGLSPYTFIPDRDLRFMSEIPDQQLGYRLERCPPKQAVGILAMLPVTRAALLIGLMGPKRTEEILQGIACYLEELTLEDCNMGLRQFRQDVAVVDGKVWRQSTANYLDQLKEFLSPDQKIFLENKPIPGLPWLGQVWSNEKSTTTSHSAALRVGTERYPEGVPDLPYEVMVDSLESDDQPMGG